MILHFETTLKKYVGEYFHKVICTYDNTTFIHPWNRLRWNSKHKGLAIQVTYEDFEKKCQLSRPFNSENLGKILKMILLLGFFRSNCGTINQKLTWKNYLKIMALSKNRHIRNKISPLFSKYLLCGLLNRGFL